jgi:hypothetical protein
MMRNEEIRQARAVRCSDEDLGRAVDEIVTLFLALEAARSQEREALRRKLAAAGFRLNRMATRREAA